MKHQPTVLRVKSIFHKYVTYILLIVIAFAVQDFVSYILHLTVNKIAMTLPTEVVLRAMYPIASIFMLFVLKT